ncbi:MAG: hypothetical protein LBJ41_01690 [Treponema sp.]|jgi:hypothetical protein|nr:hypothetical protein [Treponema sp.]
MNLAKKLGFFFGLSLIIMALFGCMTAESSVKGTPTTIDTLGGDSFDAIVLIDNLVEGVKIAKIGDNSFAIYANIMTSGRTAYPGSLIFTIDGTKNTIIGPTGWDIVDVSVDQHNVTRWWNTSTSMSDRLIESFKDATTINIRAINSSGYMGSMGEDKGIDISTILPVVNEFLSK